jgi:enolase-phosphatase E1
MTPVVVLDVEGTTSAVEHIHNELFPYAHARMADWVAEHAHEGRTRAILDEVDRRSGRLEGTDDSAAVRTLLKWAEADAKCEPLKELQGLIWSEGYERGELAGHVYADTLLALDRWRSEGTQIYIYSSGSIRAQRDLFANTQFGDLSKWLSGYFDTRSAGEKLSTLSYRNITRVVGVAARHVLFASDSVPELDVARSAGWMTAWVTRPEERLWKQERRPPSIVGHRRFRSLISLAEETPL